MKNKSFTIAEIIICIISLTLLWIDGTYKLVAKSVYGIYKGSASISFVDCSINSNTIDNPIFPIGWIFIALMVVSLVILFLEALNLKTFERKFSAILPVMSLVVFIAISIYVDSKTGGTYEYYGDLRRNHLEMGILFYVNIVLLLFSLAINILKNFTNTAQISNTLMNNRIKQENAHSSTPSNTVDTLKELKLLLDSGVITHEEFDKKKKQLLGL